MTVRTPSAAVDWGMRTSGRTRRGLAVTSLALLVVLLAGCAAGPNTAASSGPDPAGFWLGLWQGFIAPVAFVVSWFRDDVGIYEVNNTGGWYDFGFLFGISIFFSGSGGSGRAARRRRRADA